MLLFQETIRCHMAASLKGNDHTVRLHSHPFYELQYVACGEGKLFREGIGEEKMYPGMLYITPPGINHQTIPSEEMVRYYADIEIPEGLLNTTVFSIDTGQDRLLCRWFEDLTQLSRQRVYDEASAVSALILLRISGFEHRKIPGMNYHPVVRKAVNYIDLHFHEPLDVHQIAAHVSCSESYLHALFKQDLGYGPAHYLGLRRTERAKDLLAAGFLSVAEIAEKCGFPDPDYFCRKFKKLTRMTPSEYCRKIFRPAK